MAFWGAFKKGFINMICVNGNSADPVSPGLSLTSLIHVHALENLLISSHMYLKILLVN